MTGEPANFSGTNSLVSKDDAAWRFRLPAAEMVDLFEPQLYAKKPLTQEEINERFDLHTVIDAQVVRGTGLVDPPLYGSIDDHVIDRQEPIMPGTHADWVIIDEYVSDEEMLMRAVTALEKADKVTLTKEDRKRILQLLVKADRPQKPAEAKPWRDVCEDALRWVKKNRHVEMDQYNG